MDPERCLTHDNLANLGLSQQNPSSKLFWLNFVWVNDVQFPAHHKKSAKTNKNQTVASKKLKTKIPGERVTSDYRDPRCCHTPKSISDITGVISKLVGWNTNIQWGLSMMRYFSHVEVSYAILSRRLKIQTLFTGEWFYGADLHWGTLRSGFSRSTDTGCDKRTFHVNEKYFNSNSQLR